VAAGLVCVGVGAVGVVVPGLPTTVFFIAAAACFARGSRRLERWVLGLPVVGRSVGDYCAGLGMPRKAKVAALASIAVFSAIALVVVDPWWARLAIAGAAAVGAGVVGLRVPTRERVP
jgi:uncharacterized protein